MSDNSTFRSLSSTEEYSFFSDNDTRSVSSPSSVFSVFSNDSLLSTTELYPTDMSHNESQSSSFDGIRSLSANVAQMEAELDSLNRYCEEVVAHIVNDNSPTLSSTPTIVRGNRRRSDISPVEVIDLSHLELIPRIRSARNRAPDAVIDLCTPDRPISRPLNFPSDDSYTGPRRRRTFAQSSASSQVVDVEDVSPPKRIQPDPNVSQKEDSYKCPVCMDSVIKREPVATKCGHVFCRECIQTAISATHKCPMCNKKLTIRQFSRIYL
ncbi:E3 ubiquitin-protein ligase RNF4-like [Drosophila elegans]|uniref:E3 ubiquitin-protein ligase RNF4-like n=1 Tax=Drosophila elegans TaxID=30023 RepID=UPI0007E7F529|nr:E3 ubiquitin-protein ligase RNF4-like [Drosophila elegans]